MDFCLGKTSLLERCCQRVRGKAGFVGHERIACCNLRSVSVEHVQSIDRANGRLVDRVAYVARYDLVGSYMQVGRADDAQATRFQNTQKALEGRHNLMSVEVLNDVPSKDAVRMSIYKSGQISHVCNDIWFNIFVHINPNNIIVAEHRMYRLSVFGATAQVQANHLR